MNQVLGKIMFFGSIALIGVGVVILIKRAGEDSNPSGASDANAKDNFNSLLVNLGNVKAANNAVSIPFNSNQNLANFFNNNRVAIYKGKDLIGKGTYTNGGKTIVMDGGKTVNQSSVYANLELLEK